MQALDNQAPQTARFPGPPQHGKRLAMVLEDSSTYLEEEEEGCNTPSALKAQIAHLQSLVAKLENTGEIKSSEEEESSRKKKNSNTVCYNCGKSGHISRKCCEPCCEDSQDQGKGKLK